MQGRFRGLGTALGDRHQEEQRAERGLEEIGRRGRE